MSPQFSSTAQCNGPRSRRTLRRHRSPEGQGHRPECTCGPMGHGHAKVQGQTGSKFKSLEFIGEKQASVLEEVSIDENISPKITKVPGNIRKRSVAAAVAAWIDSDCEGSPVLQLKVRRRSRRTGVSRRTSDVKGKTSRGDNPVSIVTEGDSPLPDDHRKVWKENGEDCLQPPIKKLFAERIADDPDVCDSGVGCQRSVSPGTEQDTELQPRYLLRKYFDATVCSTPKSPGHGRCKILVLDTPEAEYGISVRERWHLRRARMANR